MNNFITEYRHKENDRLVVSQRGVKNWVWIKIEDMPQVIENKIKEAEQAESDAQYLQECLDKWNKEFK